MIKLERQLEPQEMLDNKGIWLGALQSAIIQYGSYADIPEDEKQKLISFYRNASVRSALEKSSFGKCAFCECIPSEGGNLEIEHYSPKSLYPHLTFEWFNFLPSCRKCNGSKSDHDTGVEPIINPYDTDPKDLFYFDDIEMKAAKSSLMFVAEKTIEVCDLNTVRLWRPRANILISLRIFSRAIHEALEQLQDADTLRKKRIRLNRLREAIDTIEELTKPSAAYSSFCSHFLDRSEIYQKARQLVGS